MILIQINGMHCTACVETIQLAISDVNNVDDIKIALDSGIAQIGGNPDIDLVISTIETSGYSANKIDQPLSPRQIDKKDNAWRELIPLFIILSYVFIGSILLNRSSLNLSNFMMGYMGLFFIVFSLFKFIDYGNFPSAFSQYDPLAHILPIYGWAYPFLELYLGINFLLQQYVLFSLALTVLLLGVTTYGVLIKLRDKQSPQCACVGTALTLPLTKATLIENFIMIAMAGWMLVTILN